MLTLRLFWLAGPYCKKYQVYSKHPVSFAPPARASDANRAADPCAGRGTGAEREIGGNCGAQREIREISDGKSGWRGRAEGKQEKVNIGAEASLRRKQGRPRGVEGTHGCCVGLWPMFLPKVEDTTAVLHTDRRSLVQLPISKKRFDLACPHWARLKYVESPGAHLIQQQFQVLLIQGERCLHLVETAVSCKLSPLVLGVQA